MSDDFKNILEINIRSYAASIRTHISWMPRDIDGLEVMGNKLIESNDWECFDEVQNYIEELQEDIDWCNKLIQRAMEDRELLKRCEDNE